MNGFLCGLRDFAIAVVLTVVLVLATAFIPGFSIAGAVVCGVPLGFLAAKHKMKFTIPALLVIFAVFYGMSLNLISALYSMLLLIIPGTVAGYMIGEKNEFFSTLLAVCVTMCVGWLVGIYLINSVVDGGIAGMLGEMRSQIEASVMQSFEQINDLGMSYDLSDVKTLIPEAVDMVIGTMQLFFPAFTVIIATALGYIILRVCGFFVRVTKAAETNIVPFSMLKAPRSMSIIAVLCYLITFFASAEFSFGAVVANVSLVLELLLAVCGVSFIDYMLKKVIRFTILRWLIYAGVAVMLFATMLFPIVSYGFVFLGILDAGRDFRKIGMLQENEF